MKSKRIDRIEIEIEYNSVKLQTLTLNSRLGSRPFFNKTSQISFTVAFIEYLTQDSVAEAQRVQVSIVRAAVNSSQPRLPECQYLR